MGRCATIPRQFCSTVYCNIRWYPEHHPVLRHLKRVKDFFLEKCLRCYQMGGVERGTSDLACLEWSISSFLACGAKNATAFSQDFWNSWLGLFCVCILVRWLARLVGIAETSSWSYTPRPETSLGRSPMWFHRRWLRCSVGCGDMAKSKRGWGWFWRRLAFICLVMVEEVLAWLFLLVVTKKNFVALDGVKRLQFVELNSKRWETQQCCLLKAN